MISPTTSEDNVAGGVPTTASPVQQRGVVVLFTLLLAYHSLRGRMTATSLTITFDDLDVREANDASFDLKRQLERSTASFGPDKADIRQEKMNSETQDFGTSLVLVLGTPAALAIAKGIHDYISKSGNRVTIRTSGGSVIATGDAAKNISVSETVEALAKMSDDSD